MATRKAKDLRDLSIEELQATVTDSRRELFELKCEQKQTKQLEKPHKLGILKKEIARMLTILNEKQQAGTVK